ncbi:VirB2 family type IV secretion system major pilin TrwL [Bartonella krasnovii]|uniref:VirB2 family type IV secretion system major pilin TrwL n=1 Tax=Bartonella krasnovii TaxID=2267275 RepID=A0ABY3VYA6_9HYPH|nr:VirB2 family type IV secretion system major pilin TrwL [Bartonella krasnovii]UNF29004.1 VirB2 family type IV secretion system major pilin TrwL [Bartonella krasnovii]UNF35359.1 VirB2 family type IV secretion system major pilin TrwL [Bartonella krasnovii]UNF36988.1 VirB2 family type IV secretion system major pilin TrwL [Bartonella krasnovii]UNF40402.1 VirB2 family type IV secretion system major pilin TrwL [Bartonella krasnovii]UNF48546.1 VirB2 family type IV secretion system major pilin TrwL 
MREVINFKLKNNNGIIAIPVALIVFFMNSPVFAQAKLTTAKTALDELQKDLTANIIPVAAAVILLCLAIGYAGRYISKDTFVRWAIGVVIAGSATQLAKLLFTGAVN